MEAQVEHVRKIRIVSVLPDPLACGPEEHPSTVYICVFGIVGRPGTIALRAPYSDVERLMQQQGVRHYSSLAGRIICVPLGFTTPTNAFRHALHLAREAGYAGIFRPAKPLAVVNLCG